MGNKLQEICVVRIFFIFNFFRKILFDEIIFCAFNCRILESNPNECQMESRPSVAMIQLQLLIMFSAGVLMSTWVWTSQTAERWQRFIKKFVNFLLPGNFKIKDLFYLFNFVSGIYLRKKLRNK